MLNSGFLCDWIALETWSLQINS